LELLIRQACFIPRATRKSEIAGRFTFLEKGAHNAVEVYTWNEKKERIDIDFTFKKDSFDGELKSIPQTAWIYNKKTNAHWKVSPFWPLKFNYLVIAVAADYSWTAIGVPDEAYLWIMAKKPNLTESEISSIVSEIEKLGYSTKDLVRVPQKW
jgi:apolipoprotein D and lipocalin family protein